MAKLFLYYDIAETEFSPMVIQHPIFESANFTTMENGEFKIVNILEDADALKKIQERYSQRIDNAKELLEIYAIIRKAYRLTFLKFVQDYLSDIDFAVFLADGWVSSENPNDDANVSLRTFVSWFRRADKKHLMTKEDYKVYKELPQAFRVYRGVGVGRNPKGLSWTQNLSTAEWFAKRFDRGSKKGYIQTAVAKKSDALAYFNTRGEDEVVVNSFNLKIEIISRT